MSVKDSEVVQPQYDLNCVAQAKPKKVKFEIPKKDGMGLKSYIKKRVKEMVDEVLKSFDEDPKDARSQVSSRINKMLDHFIAATFGLKIDRWGAYQFDNDSKIATSLKDKCDNHVFDVVTKAIANMDLNIASLVKTCKESYTKLFNRKLEEHIDRLAAYHAKTVANEIFEEVTSEKADDIISKSKKL